MRRMFLVYVAAATALLAQVAWAGNQEIADQIASSLRKNGQMSGYRITVKYQDGTVWLQGRVRDQEQMNRAMKLAAQTPGVKQVVSALTIGGAGTAEAAKAGKTTTAGQAGKQAQPLSASFNAGPAQRAVATEAAGKGNVSVAMMQAAPANGAAKLPPPPAAPDVAIPPGATPISGAPLPMYSPGAAGGQAPVRYDQPNMPNYAWPSYAAHPNYAALTYPKQYSATAWPYIGPFYPYPQVPLGWRKVTMEWHDGWWFLDFKDEPTCKWWR